MATFSLVMALTDWTDTLLLSQPPTSVPFGPAVTLETGAPHSPLSIYE